MPILPRVVEIELRSARDHYHHHERCLFCDVIRQERDAGTRVVVDNGRFVTFAPYASRSPFEMFVAPVGHQHDYCLISDEDSELLALTLNETLFRLRAALNDPPFNLVMHIAPNLRSRSILLQEFPTLREAYHWHIEIVPRLSKSAGFEWGTGFHINPTPPELAADYLRAVGFPA
jgi:UDPglucose--hexose-1-phosphate uridylyltransferase